MWAPARQRVVMMKDNSTTAVLEKLILLRGQVRLLRQRAEQRIAIDLDSLLRTECLVCEIIESVTGVQA
jgi:hypothetical protein